MEKVTAIIPTFNEEHNIAEAIDSVSWADEVLVVDSFSTDKTVEIAQQKGVRILQHEYENSATQKNWTIPQAAHPWIFLLDADERVTPKLQKEVRALLGKQKIEHDAYWIRRKNVFMGRQINHSNWATDKVIRLFKRDTCRYQDKAVHAEISTKGTISILSNHLIHNTYKDLKSYLVKLDRYAAWGAQDRLNKVEKVGFFHLFIKPGARFFIYYLLKRGFLDGKQGLIIAWLSAYSVFLRYLKLWRMKEGEKF